MRLSEDESLSGKKLISKFTPKYLYAEVPRTLALVARALSLLQIVSPSGMIG